MEKDWIVLLQQQGQLERVMETNLKTGPFGLTLTREDAEVILAERKCALVQHGRIEFGEGIVTKIIDEFCDSCYICQDDYVETIVRLQEIFYLYKNEMLDEITDDELLHFMKEQFETICFGSLEYLETTCLAVFSRAIRAGYEGYKASEGRGEYSGFDEVKRWDPELYMEALRELCWR